MTVTSTRTGSICNAKGDCHRKICLPKQYGQALILNPDKHIVILAGEHSGDMHAAKLVAELKARDPALTFSGTGGALMREEGVQLLGDRTEHVAMGVMGLPTVIRRQARLLFDIVRMLQRIRPAAVILVDSPDFNLRIAQRIHGVGIPVFYYISPQIWAWRRHRIHRIKKYVDTVLCLFDFEKEMYDKAGVDAEWIGHPLVEIIENRAKRDLRAELGLSKDTLLVGLLPGSRKSELHYIAPVLLKAAQIAGEKLGEVQYVLSRAPGFPEERFMKCVGATDIPVLENRAYDIMAASDAILVASGTATLEAAILATPMVVVYKASFLSYYPMIHMLLVKDYALANIVARRRIVPEMIQRRARPELVARKLLSILKDGTAAQMKKHLEEVRQRLGPPGAAGRAADSILKRL